jgi:hypothetical protein
MRRIVPVERPLPEPVTEDAVVVAGVVILLLSLPLLLLAGALRLTPPSLAELVGVVFSVP